MFKTKVSAFQPKKIIKIAFVFILVAVSSHIAFTATDTNTDRDFILSEIIKNQHRAYFVKKGETLSAVAKKYNANAENIRLANSDISNVNIILPTNKIIKIPVLELQNTMQKDILLANKTGEPIITYSDTNNTITVTGEGSVVTIPDIYAALGNNDKILRKFIDNKWVLRANLFIEKGVTLIIDRTDVSWLKLLSKAGKFVILRAYNGNILISSKISSWDEDNNTMDTNLADGRSFILLKYDGRMDVINSEIFFLGSQITTPEIGGGCYGISWKTPDASFPKYLVTGNILNSKIHDNYYGIYTYGAAGMVIDNNNVYNNIQYGIDPHDDSNNLIISRNKTHHNGNHGIIVSKRCLYNNFSFNESSFNKLQGMMLDRQSNFNILENDLIHDNLGDGIAVYDSHFNIIRNENIRTSKSGIRSNAESTKNYFENNIITLNRNNAIFIYGNSNSNYALNNQIFDNPIGIYFKDTTGNIIKNNFATGSNTVNIKFGVNSDGNIIE